MSLLEAGLLVRDNMGVHMQISRLFFNHFQLSLLFVANGFRFSTSGVHSLIVGLLMCCVWVFPYSGLLVGGISG